jgi:CRISPR-associated protein (TIGR03986 family)
MQQAPSTPYADRAMISLAGRSHGDECQAIIEEIEHPRRKFRFWNVVQMASTTQPPLRPGPGQKRVVGYLCITNQNIENKHDERLFFADGRIVSIELTSALRERYEELIADYKERHRDAVAKSAHPENPKGRNPAFSRFVIRNIGDKLEDGDLVYVMLRGAASGPQAEFIVPVSVPRVGFTQTIGDRLDPGVEIEDSILHKCRRYDALCPACRTFGWVSGEVSRDLAVPVAYAGRVRFSCAKLTHSHGTSDGTLAILSSPKPTTTRFYLRPADGSRPRDGEEDQQTDYSEAAKRRLRGRKFYRHHGDKFNELEYARQGEVCDDQNRSVRGIQKSGSTFEFTVDFENLAPVELGAMLWAIEMEGWNHRLGMGKPLGFGSAIIQVTDLQILNIDARYRNLESAWVPALGRKDALVNEFQEAMAERYGKEFHKLENIRDLKALLAESAKLPVHYPRPTEEPQVEGRNYEWFMGNKRSGRDAGPRLVLRLAEEDTEGLPLIDRYGKT